MSPRARRWTPAVVTFTTGLVLAAIMYGQGDEIAALLMLTVMTGWAWWTSPLHRGPHISHHEARSRTSEGDVLVYWRPGCRYCAKLRRGLGPTSDDVTWVNIWADEAAADFVAGLHEGDEKVPTVVTGSGERLSPTPEAIRDHLSSQNTSSA